ncbi:alpha/beta fold hydrolase [Paucibacter sp. TC2R-5]|uniref:alpha/beta fold hydrolase n=1 Tax=Paucibacter sp. TC2R-5 TaxID=2893555 RepID=UPI0039E1742A
MLTLVLLPGLDGTGDLFDPLVEAFHGQVKVQVVRYPRDVALGYEELQDFVRKLLPVNEPYVLLGESFSGPIAIALAAESPPSLKGLVLCCTFARNPRPSLSGASALLPLVPFRSMPSVALSQMLLGRFSSPTLRRAVAGAVGQVSSEVLRARVRAVLAVDVSAALARVRMPCIYLRAMQDRLVPKSAAAHIKVLLPSVEVVQIEAPHCLLQARPKDASVVVSKFMREVGSAL